MAKIQIKTIQYKIFFIWVYIYVEKRHKKRFKNTEKSPKKFDRFF